MSRGAEGTTRGTPQMQRIWQGPVLVFLMAFVSGFLALKVPVPGPFLPLLCGVGTALLAWMIAWTQLRLAWMIADTPTVAVKGAFIGRCEIQGRLTSVTPLLTPFTAVAAVYCDWKVEELRRGRRRREWVTVDSGTLVAHDSYAYDETGSIWVDLPAAHVRCGQTYAAEVPGARPRRRNVERTLPQHEAVYVLGHAQFREGAPVLHIGDDGDTPFLVSNRSEQYERRRLHVIRWVLALTGLAFGLFGVMIEITGSTGSGRGTRNTYALVPNSFRNALIFAGLYFGAFAIGYVVRQYNRLVEVRVRAEGAWSLIDVQLTRRAALIPQLVEVVRAYAAYEQSVQGAVAYERSASRMPQRGEVEAADRVAVAQDHCSADLLARVEGYADLKASENFLALQAALVDADDRVAFARRFYNDAVETWRDRASVFPWRFLARFVHGPELLYFQTEDQGRAAVFDGPDGAWSRSGSPSA